MPANQERSVALTSEAASDPSPRVRSIQSGSALPQSIAPFVGRAREIATLRTLLADPSLRLLTLVGPGGVGKTRLAIQAVSGMADVLQRSVLFVGLAAVGSADGVAIAIANTLDASDGGARPLIEGIRAALRDRPTLVVLDNLEHVLPDAARFVSELLAACPSLNILATSRAPLRLYGERRFPVYPLSTATANAAFTEDPEAIQLFLLRARSVDPELVVDADIRNDITRICTRLDGLPLAIELAAARVAELPPREYLVRLERHLPLPSGGSRDMPQRQQTMTAAVGWSYELLDQAQQAMFRRMAVFSGEFDLVAAEEMAADIPADESPEDGSPRSPVDLLAGLVEASLVQRRPGPAGQARYHILETIRAYGLDRARESGEDDLLHRRHALLIAGSIEKANHHLLSGRNTIQWLDYLDDRLSNIRAALAWCTAHDRSLLVRMTRSLMQAWIRQSRIQEGIGWLRGAEAAGDLTELERGWTLANLGRLSQYTSADMADHAYAQALAIARDHDDRALELTVRIGQTMRAAITRQPEEAYARLAAARAVPGADRIVASISQPTFLSTLEALVAGVARDYEHAGSLARQTLQLALTEGDEISPALLHRILGNVRMGSGDREAARDHLLRALEIYETFGEEWNIASCMMDMATLFQHDSPALSIRLAGAADTLLAIHGAYRIQPDHEPYRSIVIELREQIGDDAVQAAWEEGTAQPWASTLHLARTTQVDHVRAPVERRLPLIPAAASGILTPREHEVLRLIADGRTDREIAADLGLTYRTVTTYVTNILTKLNVPSRAAAVTQAMRAGLLET